MRSLLVAITLAIVITPSAAQRLRLPEEVALGDKIVAEFEYKVPEGGKLSMLWSVSDGLVSEEADQRLFLWGNVGDHRVDLVVIPMKTITVDGQTFDVIAGEIQRHDQRFKITGTTPPPDPVDPVDPPDPTPDKAPFPAPGLTVMVVRESQLGGELPPEQAAIFTNSKVIGWWNDNCVKLDGSSAARIWDDDYTDSQLGNTHPVLRNAYRETLKDADGRLPWIAISTGSDGYSGPLPANVDDTLALLEQYN